MESIDPRTPTTLLLAVAIAAALLGCADSARDEPTYTVVDSAGVRIVVNERPRWEPGEAWAVSVTPVMDVGAVEGDARLQFHDVLGVTRLGDGRVAVLDGGSAELRFFGPAGEHLASIGGPGEGPGEISRPSGLLRVAGDTLGVATLANWAVSWFTPAGDFIRMERLDAARHAAAVGTMFGCPERPALLPDATFLACVGEGAVRNQLDAAPRVSHLLVRSPYDVSWVDTVGTMYGFNSLGFGARPTQVAAGGDPLRLYIGDPAFFEIDVVEDRSGRVASIRYPNGLRPVEAGDRAAHDTYMEAWRRSLPPGALTSEPASLYASFMPGFVSLHHDPEGYLWAVEHAPPWEEGRSALVFSVDGPLLGRLDLPDGFMIREIGRDFILGVARDALGVEFVRMYGLERR